MATILLAAAGSALGSSALGFLGTIGGVSVGAVLGQAVGALAGAAIDGAIVSALSPKQQGPRLAGVQIQSAAEGATMKVAIGRYRFAGEMIWATRFEESSQDVGGGKSGGAVVTEYSYFGNFAIGLCEGTIGANFAGVSALDALLDIDGTGRIFLDGAEIDRTQYTIRVYPGDEEQAVDPLIEAKEGVDNSPAYRGTAYIVFERLPLENWGNRYPQVTAEVYRPVGDIEGRLTGPGVIVEAGIEGIAVIGGGEFGLDTTIVTRSTSDGDIKENRNTLAAASDIEASLDGFERVSAAHHSVLLIVPWFGDDLRAAHCTLKPKVDSSSKSTSPYSWAVSGLGRGGAGVVTDPTLRATPSDLSVIRALREIWSRGRRAVLCPMLIMDIASSNTLPNPYSNGAGTDGQPAYPWRGLITCSPAAGFTGSVDQTSTAATQVATFMGSAATGDFHNSGDTITYSGSAEWSYRRMVLQYAKLMAQAVAGADINGESALFLGGGLTGLERIRSDGTTYPFVAALKTLAADCRTILGAETTIVSNEHPPPSTVDIGVKLGYAADWTSWNNHRPDDASGDVLFNLDPLWSDSNIAFIGIDAFFPLTDWRDGASHLDFNPVTGPISPKDRAYLEANVAGGEYYDWVYADDAARAAQTRTAIEDSDPADEPWVFRQKDILNWFLNTHHDRPLGVRSGTATDWVAKGKQIVLSTYGCAAVDKGANLPHAGMHGREALPYGSSGARDDGMQRAWFRALLSHYRNVGLDAGSDTFNNPYSSVTQQFMVPVEFSHAYAWDARPWPSFPQDASWPDAAAWQTGHWLTDRLGTAPAEETIAAILDSAGFSAYAIEALGTSVDGICFDQVTSPRAMLEALQAIYRFDAVDAGAVIKFLQRDGRPPVLTLTRDDLVVDPDQPGPSFKMTRTDPTELPDVALISYGDPERDDSPGQVLSQRLVPRSGLVVSFAPPVVLDQALAQTVADTELNSAWVGAEQSAFSLPPSLALLMDPAEILLTQFGPVAHRVKVTTLSLSDAVGIEAGDVPAANFSPAPVARSAGRSFPNPATLASTVALIDGPLLNDTDLDYAGYVAGIKAPFGSGISLYRSPSGSGYVLDDVLSTAAAMGQTTADFASGPTCRWDRRNTLSVNLIRGSLSSAEELQVFNGANPILLQNQDGEWELLQFQTATPTGTRAYDLTNLLRGQKGTEHAMRDPVPAGARIVALNSAVRQTGLTSDLVGLLLNWEAGPAELGVGGTGYVSFAATMNAKARRPLSPVQLSGMRDAGTGDWALSWIRRTRIGGDSWNQVEVPLGEASEAYRLQILDGITVVREVDVDEPAFAYTAAMQTTDFGGAQATLSISVAQLSATYGPGIAAIGDIIETRRTA